MNRLFTIFLTAALGIATSHAQSYSVTTEPTQTKILLEEFTGVHCIFCTEGHEMARELQRALPGESFVVAIHAGSFAATSGYEAGFTTTAGQQLVAQFGAEDAGYPCGMVNRRDYSPIPVSQQYVMSRSLWLPRAQELHSQTAPLNLLVRSSYDGLTNRLSVRVEGYYTAQQQAAEQYLTVLWTQSDVKGYQKNGGKGSDYMHQHMLRGMLSDLWGDRLDTPQQGQYFARDYSITLPQDVNGVAVVPEDIEVVAFVSTGRANILQVDGGKPDYTNYGQELKGTVLVPDMAMGTRYGYDFFEAYVKSHTMQTVTSATFDVTVNDVTQAVTVACDIPQFTTSELLHIPATYTYKERGSTKYEVRLTHLNGQPVDGGSISGSFQKPNSTDGTVKIELLTDHAASENRFLLRDQNGNILQEFGPFADGQQTAFETTVTGLEDGKTYCVEVADMLGNGMTSGQKGSLVTRTGEGKLIDAFYTISDFGVRSFFTVEGTAGIIAIESVNGKSVNGKSVNGKSVNGKSVNGKSVNGKSVNGKSVNGKSHDLLGRVVTQSPQKGLLITDGKKVIRR